MVERERKEDRFNPFHTHDKKTRGTEGTVVSTTGCHYPDRRDLNTNTTGETGHVQFHDQWKSKYYDDT